jgi:hypothetical protein
VATKRGGICPNRFLSRAANGFILLAAMAMGACVAANDQMQEKLHDATDAYFRHLRWQDFDRAVEYLPAESADAFLLQCEKWRENLVIVDEQLTRLKLEKKDGVALARREVHWHVNDSTVVKHTTIDQIWQWHHGNWVLVEETTVTGPSLARAGGDQRDEEEQSEGLSAGDDVAQKTETDGSKAEKSRPHDERQTAYLPGLVAYQAAIKKEELAAAQAKKGR